LPGVDHAHRAEFDRCGVARRKEDSRLALDRIDHLVAVAPLAGHGLVRLLRVDLDREYLRIGHHRLDLGRDGMRVEIPQRFSDCLTEQICHPGRLRLQCDGHTGPLGAQPISANRQHHERDQSTERQNQFALQAVGRVRGRET